ncbi:MAG TPA: glycerate kinase [Chitinophagaceae bacterium]|nr:glycerate kinase [Chitinophagaceae bacterium]
MGRKITASFGLINEGITAVIEMADASGLRLLKQSELNPLRASSSGTGTLLKAALDKGVEKIIIAMGGSATVDGGIGILGELGVRFLDSNNKLLQNIPEAFGDLAHISLSHLDGRIFNCEVIILCDVNNTLLGAKGAAAVFGPQKGATAEMIEKLEVFLSKLNEVVLEHTGIDMSVIKSGGTAGGAAAGLSTLINAKLVNGIDYFLQLTNFDEAVKRNDLVITGEGSIDNQTLQGKGPYGVASKAKQNDLQVIGIAGIVPLSPNEELEKYFDVLIAIGHEPHNMQTAMRLTSRNLKRVAKQIGNLLSVRK